MLRSSQSLSHDNADTNQQIDVNSFSSSQLDAFFWDDENQTTSPSKHLNDDSSKFFLATQIDLSLSEQQATGLDDVESSLLETLQVSLSESFLNDQAQLSDNANAFSSSSSLQSFDYLRTLSPTSRLVPSKVLEMLNSNSESLILDEIHRFKHQSNQMLEMRNCSNAESMIVSELFFLFIAILHHR